MNNVCTSTGCLHKIILFVWVPASPVVCAFADKRSATFKDKFWYGLHWFRYWGLPLPVKFAIMSFWTHACQPVLLPLFKKYILLRCRLEALFSGKPKDIFVASGGAECRFSRAAALRRFHGDLDPERVRAGLT